MRSSSPDSVCQLPAVRCALKVVYHSRVAASDMLGSDLLWTSTPLAQPEAIKVHLRSCQLCASAVSGACDLHVVHHSMQHWQTSILYALHTLNHYGSTSRWPLIMGQKGKDPAGCAHSQPRPCKRTVQKACAKLASLLEKSFGYTFSALISARPVPDWLTLSCHSTTDSSPDAYETPA